MLTRGKGWGRDSQGVWDGHGHTLHLIWRTSKDLLDSTENSAQCSVKPGWQGSLGENGYTNMYG